VRTLDAIIRDAEQLPPLDVEVTGTSAMHVGHGRALCDAALTLASHADAAAIVAVTREGATARVLSSLRPSATIFAATEQPEVARRLTLYRGVHPLLTDFGNDVEGSGRAIADLLVSRGLVPPGSNVVFVSISQDLTRTMANYLKLHRVEAGARS
jgi:pyruvate kinase